jgi:thiol-disulfide isomerase/thioredoxin
MWSRMALVGLLTLIIPLPAFGFNFSRNEPKEVPAFGFTDAAGNELTLADFRGKVVVLNLWATWCAPCRREMPSLDRLQAEHRGDDLLVLPLSVDRADLAKIQEFYEEVGVEHLDIYRDPKAAASRALGAFGLPTTVVIDREGRDVGRLLGPAEWDGEEAVALLRSLLDE